MSKKKKFRFKNYDMNVEAKDDMSYAEYDIVKQNTIPIEKDVEPMSGLVIEEAMRDKKRDNEPGVIIILPPDDGDEDDIPGAAHVCAFCGKCHPRYVKMNEPFECRNIEVLWALGYKVVANPVEAWRI